jgi:hypothetical protein
MTLNINLDTIDLWTRYHAEALAAEMENGHVSPHNSTIIVELAIPRSRLTPQQYLGYNALKQTSWHESIRNEIFLTESDI